MNLSRSYSETIREDLEMLKSGVFKPGADRREIAETLIKEGKETDDAYLEGAGLYGLSASFYTATRNPKFVLPSAEMALPKLQAAGDHDLICSLYILLAVMEIDSGSYTSAMDYLELAEQAALKSGSAAWNQAKVLSNTAVVYYQVDDMEQALRYTLKAIDISSACMDHPGYFLMQCINIFNAGIGYIEARKDAINARKMLEIYEQMSDDPRWQTEDNIRLLRLKMELAGCENRTAEADLYIHQILPILHREDIILTNNIQAVFTAAIRLNLNDACEELVEIIHTHKDTYSPAILANLIDLEIRYFRSIGDEKRLAEAYPLYYDIMTASLDDKGRSARETIRTKQKQIETDRENIRLNRQAGTDALTGIANRYGLNKNANDIFSRCLNYQTNLGVEILDVDFFKEYNDNYGHQAGDIVLECVAEVLRSLSSDNEHIFVSRYGGDEFVILYENMDDEQIQACSRMIQLRIRDDEIIHAFAPSGRLTVSQGIFASVPKETHRLWDYLTSADNALYQAKNSSKGSCIFTHTFADSSRK